MASTTTLFRTARSALLAHTLEPEWTNRLVDLVNEVDPLLVHHPEMRIYGKVCHMQRSVGFFSNDSVGYRYSGQLASSQPIPPGMLDLLLHINERFGASYNGVLVNKYASGEEYISKHSDDERALDPQHGVMALSIGVSRTFRVRDKTTNAIVLDIPTDEGQILNMTGEFQREFTHEVPVERRVAGVRYSFTFRHHTE